LISNNFVFLGSLCVVTAHVVIKRALSNLA
jgi:hypothetical protein